jgi:signal transduction histidine kinase
LKDKIVRNDLLKIKQILENLLSNAITYSHPHTTVSLIAENIGDSDLSGEYFAKLTVRDQGPGIPEDELPHIFDKFCKISNKPTGNEVSSGMGLAIAKKLSSITHTNLVCETQRGKGSDFILYLPKHLEVPKNEE